MARAVDFAVPLRSYILLPLLDQCFPHTALKRIRYARDGRASLVEFLIIRKEFCLVRSCSLENRRGRFVLTTRLRTSLRRGRRVCLRQRHGRTGEHE